MTVPATETDRSEPVTPLQYRILDWFFSWTWVCRQFRYWQLKNGTNGPPFVHLSRPQSAQLFLIYGGMDAYVKGGSICGMGLLKFLQVSGLAGRNMTWIRDPYLNNFEQGFGGDIPDLPSLEAWHRAHLASMPHVREVYTLGYSSGSYGAVLFGHLLGVKKVFAFSSRTSKWETDAAAKAALKDRLVHHNGVTEYELWYAHKNRLDHAFAQNIVDCPGVHAHVHSGHGATHFLINKMIQSGEFQTLLPPDPGVAAVTSPSLSGG